MHLAYTVAWQGGGLFDVRAVARGGAGPHRLVLAPPAGAAGRTVLPCEEDRVAGIHGPASGPWTFDQDAGETTFAYRVQWSPSELNPAPPWFALIRENRAFLPAGALLATAAGEDVVYTVGTADRAEAPTQAKDRHALVWTGLSWGGWRELPAGPPAPGWRIVTDRSSPQSADDARRALLRMWQPLVSLLGPLDPAPRTWFDVASGGASPCGLALSNGVLTSWPGGQGDPEDPFFLWMLAHELAHLWIGFHLRLEAPALDWLKEGAASWLAYEVSVQAGVLSRQEADRRLRQPAGAGDARGEGLLRCVALDQTCRRRGAARGLCGLLGRLAASGRRFRVDEKTWSELVAGEIRQDTF